MKAFSRRFLIKDGIIIKKNNGKSYRLPTELEQRIHLYSLEFNFECLGNEFMQFLIKEGIIDECSETYDPYVVDSKEYQNVRLFIQLTGNCNLKCRHCFLGGSAQENNFYNYKRITKVVDEAVKHGISRIDFTGGEITTITFLDKLISYLDSKPIQYIFFTNLAFVDKKILNSMAKAIGLARIITSIDYFTAAKHDSFRGKKGAFESTYHNVIELYKKGINITINTMVLKDNHEDIKKMIDYFIPMGIGMHFDTVIQKGNAVLNKEILEENPDESIDFIYECMEYVKRNYGIDIDVDMTSCGVGKTLLYLDKDGMFQLCPGLTSRESEIFYLGKTLEDAFGQLQKFDLCCEDRNCEFYLKCNFGCREKAFFNFGSINAPDKAVCSLLKRELKSGEIDN